MQFFRVFEHVWPMREPKKHDFKDFVNEYRDEVARIRIAKKMAERAKKRRKRVRFEEEGGGLNSELASNVGSAVRSEVDDIVSGMPSSEADIAS